MLLLPAFLSAGRKRKKKPQGTHAEVSASQAPAVQKEHIKGNKYGILVPGELVVLESLDCIVDKKKQKNEL